MNKKRVIIFIYMATILLSACSSSPQGIQTSMVKTQMALTPTPTRTSTSTPMSTPTPTVTLTSMPTNGPSVLYSDDFSNNQSGWDQWDEDGMMVKYSDGKYVISGPYPYYSMTSCAYRSFKDAVLVVDAFIVSGSTEENGPVVMWRYSDGKYYYFLLTGVGFYELWKGYPDTMQYLKMDFLSDGIYRVNQSNRIAIAFNSSTTSIYINDKYITSFQDSEFTSGDICLGASTGQTSAVEVSFDNLVIYTIDSWTPPK